MFFLKLTFYTCVFYLAISLPIILGELAVEHWRGMFSIFFRGRSGMITFTAFWGIVWLVSFLLAFRIVFGSRMWSYVFRPIG